MTRKPDAAGPRAAACEAVADRDTTHQLHVGLRGVYRPIWRRLLVPSRATLGLLHCVLQEAFGWSDGHPHAFRCRERWVGAQSDEFGIEDEWSVTLAEFVPRRRQRCIYKYDFGDNWQHQVVVERILRGAERLAAPECVAGERAGPLEDRGGIGEHYRMVSVLENSRHIDHEFVRQQVGDWDPDRFDLVALNSALSRLVVE